MNPIENLYATIDKYIDKKESDPYLQTKILKKTEWEEVAKYIKAKEINFLQELKTTEKINVRKIITLRLDGVGFSRKIKMLKKKGALENEKGMSQKFANIMYDVALYLGKEFCAEYIHSHSDEITIIMKQPCLTTQKPEYIYAGKYTKIVSVAAGIASSKFTQLIGFNDVALAFDCRIGIWDSMKEAFSLILWRSYDAIINGVSDLVYHSGIKGCKEIVKKGTNEKLLWLEENKIPIQKDRIYGLTFKREKVLKKIINPITKEDIEVERNDYIKYEGNIIYHLDNL